MKRKPGSLRLLAGLLVLVGLVLLAFGGVAWAGPVTLMGIDAEDGGVGGHGPITVYDAVVNSVLAQVTNGGLGILVIGGGKTPGDDVTAFWNQIASDTGQPVTYANGAAAIGAQSFAGFAMIAVVSGEFETPDGGLTQAENDALATRQADVAAFVNGGGGLLGFSQTGFTNPYAYIAAVGAFTTNTGLGYEDITPTPEGLAVGITDDLDVCCWHDEYITFPAFLSVLATNVDTGNPAAIDGATVIIVVGADLSITKTDTPDPVLVRSNLTYTLTVTNNGPSDATDVTVTDTLPAGVTLLSASGGCTLAAGIVTCNLGPLADGATAAVTIVVRPTATGTLTNTATVAATEPDPDPTNNTATALTTVTKPSQDPPKPPRKPRGPVKQSGDG